MTGNKRFGCLCLLLVFLLCISMLFNFAFLASGGARLGGSHFRSEPAQFEEVTVEEGTDSSPDKIAVIRLQGIISSSVDGVLGGSMVDDAKTSLRQAVEDEHVKAIVLNIDSPGGEVTASDVIYNAVRKAREKKPVVVYMGSLAASGGYYISCGGSYLMANDTTITGSIGVIIQTFNIQQLLGKLGVEAVVFKSGQFKDILSGMREMTPEEKKYIQDLVMQTYGKFVGIVSEERKLPVEQLRSGIADGRVLSGKDALAAKLINQLGQIEDAYAKAKELGNAPNAWVVKYEAPFRLGRLFRMIGHSESSKIEINLSQQLLPHLESGKIYLLPSFYLP